MLFRLIRAYNYLTSVWHLPHKLNIGDLEIGSAFSIEKKLDKTINSTIVARASVPQMTRMHVTHGPGIPNYRLR